MNQTHRTSFLITISLLFLLPIFFIPGGSLSLDVAKSALLAFGVIAAILLFLLETWRKGEVSIPWHLFIPVALLLPAVYFFSALSSTPSFLSFFGYNFEVGTFGYMFLVSALLILISVIFTDAQKTLQALTAFFISFALIAVFTTVKILSGSFPVWGIFFSNTDNPIGKWTDLATAFGLLSVFSILVLGMLPMKKPLRILSYFVFLLSTVLFAIVNFSTAFIFTLGASVILFLYFQVIEKHFLNTATTLPQTSPRFFLKPTFLPIVLAVVSLVFLINPTVSSTSGDKLSDVVTRTFKVSNTEVRPSFSATLSVSKAALSESVFLGSGPNTFSQDWLIYKPTLVNTTPFWGVAFPFGVGFIPTQVASTGVVGIALWFTFFVFLIILGVKALSRIPESRALRFTLVTSFIALLYLWVASFFYTPSFTMLTLAFTFSGLFLAACRQIDAIPSRTIIFSKDITTRLVSTLLVAILVIGSGALGFVAFEKTTSAFYFNKAANLSNTAGVTSSEVEGALNKAIESTPTDIYYAALSRVHFARAQEAAAKTTGIPEENLATFEDSISKSIIAARRAVEINSAGYQNWVTLGIIYSFLVPKPFSVPGAYENAVFAYSEASKTNPATPEVALLMARLELNRDDAEAARSFIRQSLALKENYADAYLMLAQLEVQQQNIGEAINSAERVAMLIPNNPGIYFELGLLKYSNRDYTGAANAFIQAVNLVPDYANAKYYLGLSLARLGYLEEARGQFEALLVTNPDSVEVQSILEDLRAGKTSFLD